MFHRRYLGGPWAHGPGSTQDRSRIDPRSIQDRSRIDPGSIQDRSRICLFISFISFMCFFPWPMYKRCATKNNHRRPENKGELLTTSKWCLKYLKCVLPIIFAGGCALQGQKSWPKRAFYIFFCKIMKNTENIITYYKQMYNMVPYCIISFHFRSIFVSFSFHFRSKKKTINGQNKVPLVYI